MNWSKTISQHGKNIRTGLLIAENHRNTIKMDEEVEYQAIKHTEVEAIYVVIS